MPVQNLTDSEAVEALTQWAAVSHIRRANITPRKNVDRPGVSWMVILLDGRPYESVGIGTTLGQAVRRALQDFRRQRG